MLSTNARQKEAREQAPDGCISGRTVARGFPVEYEAPLTAGSDKAWAALACNLGHKARARSGFPGLLWRASASHGFPESDVTARNTHKTEKGGAGKAGRGVPMAPSLAFGP